MFDEKGRYVIKEYQKNLCFQAFCRASRDRWEYPSGAVTITGGRRCAASGQEIKITP